MLDRLRKVRDYFYRQNPIELTENEAKAEKLLPKKSDVENGNAEPLPMCDFCDKAEDEFDVHSKTAMKWVSQGLAQKGVAEKLDNGGWVSRGGSKKVINEDRIMGLFIFMALLSLFAGTFAREQSFTSVGVVLLGVSLIFWK